MKARNLLVFIFIFIMVAILILFPLGQNYAESVYLKNLSGIENKSLVSTIIVLPDDQDQWDEAEVIIERISGLPEGLLQVLKKNGIKIKLFTGSLTDQREAAHLKRVQPRGYSSKNWDEVPGMGGSKTVLVKIGHSEKGAGHGSTNLELHELGHSVDQIILNNISETGYFQDAWLKEVQQLFPNQAYFIDYPEEYFAEVFAMYYFNQETKAECLEKAPLTYEIIRNIEQNGYTVKEQ